VTDTLVDAVADPPAPVAAILYCVVLDGHTCCVPLGATLPSPGSMDAPVAFSDDHLSVVHCPRWTDAGSAVMRAVGAGGGGATGAGAGGGAGVGGGAGAFATGHRAFACASAFLARSSDSARRHDQ
jgi:hypothetical protein